MAVPLFVADTVARLIQKAPGSPRIAPEIAFAEIPAITEQLTIPTRHGELRAITYLPEGGPAGRGVYVNLHGGGFVIRHPEQDDPLCRYIASNATVTVLNVDYIPAPQSRFPGPVEQAYDAAIWAASADRPWDGSRLAIGGQSAGGALAAGAARLALEKAAPHISLQVLMYPPLDLTIPAKSKVTDGKETFLVRMGPIFDTAYCPDISRRSDLLISPAAATEADDLTGIATALIITAQKDILRDEGVRYAERLARAGALLDYLDLPDVGHGFNILNAPRGTVLAAYERIAHHTTQVLT